MRLCGSVEPSPEAVSFIQQMCAKAYGCGWPLDLRAKLVMLLHDIYMSVLGAKSAADTIVTLRVLICQRMPSEQVLREVIQQAMNSVRRRYHPNRSLELLKHLLTTPCPTESANLPGEAASSEPLDLADLNRELAIVETLHAPDDASRHTIVGLMESLHASI